MMLDMKMKKKMERTLKHIAEEVDDPGVGGARSHALNHYILHGSLEKHKSTKD